MDSVCGFKRRISATWSIATCTFIVKMAWVSITIWTFRFWPIIICHPADCTSTSIRRRVDTCSIAITAGCIIVIMTPRWIIRRVALVVKSPEVYPCGIQMLVLGNKSRLYGPTRCKPPGTCPIISPHDFNYHVLKVRSRCYNKVLSKIKPKGRFFRPVRL